MTQRAEGNGFGWFGNASLQELEGVSGKSGLTCLSPNYTAQVAELRPLDTFQIDPLCWHAEP